MHTVSSLPLGRRETLKAEKRRRIIQAARRVFRDLGFERATTQEIAREAGIAAGTLFLYARDKRELLLMVFNDQLETITDESIAAAPAGSSLENELLELYRRRFEFWASDVPLARVVTADVYASRAPGEAGAELERVQARQQRLLTALTEKVAAYAERSGIALREPPETIATALHYLYIGELRAWLCREEPLVHDALENLRRLQAVVIRGMVDQAPRSLVPTA